VLFDRRLVCLAHASDRNAPLIQRMIDNGPTRLTTDEIELK